MAPFLAKVDNTSIWEITSWSLLLAYTAIFMIAIYLGAKFGVKVFYGVWNGLTYMYVLMKIKFVELLREAERYGEEIDLGSYGTELYNGDSDDEYESDDSDQEMFYDTVENEEDLATVEEPKKIGPKISRSKHLKLRCEMIQMNGGASTSATFNKDLKSRTQEDEEDDTFDEEETLIFTRRTRKSTKLSRIVQKYYTRQTTDEEDSSNAADADEDE